MSDLSEFVYGIIIGTAFGATLSGIITRYIHNRRFKIEGVTVDEAKQKLDQLFEESDEIVVIVENKETKVKQK